MSEEKLLNVAPQGIRALEVGIVAHDSEFYDISGNITELSLYESIYYPYVYGQMIVVDNSMMLTDFPFIGQERATVSWERDDTQTTRVFYITKVKDVARSLDGVGTYELSLASVVQTRNSVSLFYKAYKGKADEIISDIFTEQLGASVTSEMAGKTSHNVVFPYMKPLQAVDMVRGANLAEDETPLFVYDSFYPNEIKVDSLARMYSQEPIMTISARKPTNTDKGAQASKMAVEDRGMVFDESISRAYDMYGNLNKGTLGSTVTITDPSSHEYQKLDFDYKALAPSLAKDWVSPQYVVNGSAPNEQFSTRNLFLHRNQYAYNDDFPNLNTIDDYDLSLLNSYSRRHSMSTVKLYMDSVAYTIESNQPFGVGKTVNYELSRFMPKLGQNEDDLDKFNSGKYIIAAIRHYIKNYEYTMSVELIRDGVGDEAEI